MPFRSNILKVVPALLGVVVLNGGLYAQNGFEPQGSEYSVAGALPGDQVHSDVSVGTRGGYLVWQDNHTDGSGAGISAVRLNSSSTAAFEVFRVNSISEHDQELPRVVGLEGGNHLFVWQGGAAKRQDIYAKAVGEDGLFLSAQEVRVNSHTTTTKSSPAVASLSNGGGVVVWSSFGQDDSQNASAVEKDLQGVYGRLVTEAGVPIGDEFLVNQTVRFGQRTPAVSGLSSGDFVAVWVTERVDGSGNHQAVAGVNIMGRIFSGENALALSDEFQINATTNICANPSVVGTLDGGFVVAWSERQLSDVESSWDIAVRSFPSATVASGGAQRILNTHRYGDQFAPRISGSGSEQLVVWTSLGQDGSQEGVFGRFVSDGLAVGSEFRVNTENVSMQSMPVVSSQTENSMLVVWSSFVGGAGSVDLNAQRYAVSIPRPGAPILSASSSYELFVAWPEVAGFDIEEYLLHVDEAEEPVSVVENFARISGLNPGSAHTVRLAYKLTDGRVSPLSEMVEGRTHGADFNFDGLPDDWQKEQFGPDSSTWAGPLVDSDGDGVNNLNEFLAGTNANNVASVLQMSISQSEQGWRLYWNVMPGLVYRVQASSNFNEWVEIGGYRFAAGVVDSTFIEPSTEMEYYRVIRIR